MEEERIIGLTLKEQPVNRKEKETLMSDKKMCPFCGLEGKKNSKYLYVCPNGQECGRYF